MKHIKMKFYLNDLVHINKELPEYMSHFVCDKDAIVIGYSYNGSQIGNDWEHSYSLLIKGIGAVSWYNNSNLVLIKHDQRVLLEKWRKTRWGLRR